MAKGMEMLFSSMLKGMGLEPEMIMRQVEGIFTMAVAVEQRLQRIEEMLERIEALQRGAVLSNEIDLTAITEVETGEQVNGNRG